MRVLSCGAAIILAGAVTGAAAAQPIAMDAIPGKSVGIWVEQGGKCDTPSFVISAINEQEYRFSFPAPAARDLHVKIGVPPPRVVGSPPTVYFQTQRPAGSDGPRYMHGADIRMPGPDVLDASFPMGDGKYVPFKRYTRCAAAGIG